MKQEYPILEFDTEKNAFINPATNSKPIDIPEHGVFCFFHEVLAKLHEEGKLRIIHKLRSETGPRPIYELDFNGRRIVVSHPGVGAPMAAMSLEEVIALGGRKFIVCGGAGALQKDITLGHIVIPDVAVRDEGTSYHYLAPGRDVVASGQGITAIKKTLDKYKYKYVVAKTWTTDAFYRETTKKIALRKQEGCVTVEMECAALFAVAQFREVPLAQILYGGDDLSCEVWDSRCWDKQTSVRERIFWLAVEACLEM